MKSITRGFAAGEEVQVAQLLKKRKEKKKNLFFFFFIHSATLDPEPWFRIQRSIRWWWRVFKRASSFIFVYRLVLHRGFNGYNKVFRTHLLCIILITENQWTDRVRGLFLKSLRFYSVSEIWSMILGRTCHFFFQSNKCRFETSLDSSQGLGLDVGSFHRWQD